MFFVLAGVFMGVQLGWIRKLVVDTAPGPLTMGVYRQAVVFFSNGRPASERAKSVPGKFILPAIDSSR